jgi:uncharacterized protein (UPF0276 family)
VGVGLRQPHYRAFCEGETACSAADFVEVHSENFFAQGGAARAVLASVRSDWPVSLHGVGLGLGNALGARAQHLAKLKALVDWIEPVLISEHVCWTADGAAAYNDLLPLPHTREALSVLCDQIDQTQNALARSILIENATAYVRFAGDEMTEAAFLAEAHARTGCGILLDVNNLYINSRHFGFDPIAALDELPRGAVQQIHIAGHLETPDGLVDDHGSRAKPAVWALYQEAIARFGAAPTLIEWDTDVPALEVLMDEATTARGLQQKAIVQGAVDYVAA